MGVPLAALWKRVSTHRVLTFTAKVWAMSMALSGRGSFCSELTHTLEGRKEIYSSCKQNIGILSSRNKIPRQYNPLITPDKTPSHWAQPQHAYLISRTICGNQAPEVSARLSSNAVHSPSFFLRGVVSCSYASGNKEQLTMSVKTSTISISI